MLTMLDISDWVMSSMETEENPKTMPYKKVEQKFLALAKDFHCGNLVEYDKKQDKYYHTRQFEDDSESMAFVDDYTEEIFWEELAGKLSKRDFSQKVGELKFKEMNPTERFQNICEFEEKYNEEFQNHGLTRLKIDKKTT